MKKIGLPEEELFTFKAYCERVIDGDTLIALIDCGFGNYITQRLRLRNIDTPELSAPEGLKAKRFVQRRLNTNPFMIIKSYKTYTTDKYDRYLVDVFFLSNEPNPHTVSQQGRFLNQELLDAGLAVLA